MTSFSRTLGALLFLALPAAHADDWPMLGGRPDRNMVSNEKGLPVQREPLLTELKQRIRDVRPGPDGLLYVLTEEDSGALLKIEPAP